MSAINCMCCCSRVPSSRAKFLKDTGRPMLCIRCTGESARMVLMEYGHKTAGFAVTVPRGSERIAMRCYRRSR